MAAFRSNLPSAPMSRRRLDDAQFPSREEGPEKKPSPSLPVGATPSGNEGGGISRVPYPCHRKFLLSKSCPYIRATAAVALFAGSRKDELKIWPAVRAGKWLGTTLTGACDFL
jgi:hypothetical protein